MFIPDNGRRTDRATLPRLVRWRRWNNTVGRRTSGGQGRVCGELHRRVEWPPSRVHCRRVDAEVGRRVRDVVDSPWHLQRRFDCFRCCSCCCCCCCSWCRRKIYRAEAQCILRKFINRSELGFGLKMKENLKQSEHTLNRPQGQNVTLVKFTEIILQCR